MKSEKVKSETFHTATLSNGLRVIQLDAQSPVVYCGYEVAAGSRDELPGEEGLAHFCEHVSFKGTDKRSAWNILNCLETVGGDLNAFTNKEETVFHAAVLKPHVARAVSLLTDIVFRNQCAQEEIDKEVEVICDEIVSWQDTPADLIYDEMENILFRNHPLGHNILGTATHVRAFTTADSQRFTQRLYHPANAVFFLYGDCPIDRLVRLLEKATAGLPAGEPVRRPKVTTAWGTERVGESPIVQERHFHQAHVMMGTTAYDIHDPRRTALYLLNNILGGPGMNSRLNVSLRERRGLVYDAESFQMAYGDTGLWTAYYACDHKDMATCRRLVLKEIDRLAGRPIGDAALRAAKRQLKGQLGMASDSHENFAISFGKTFLHTGNVSDLDALFRRIDAVSAQDLQQVAADILQPARLTTLILE